MDVAKRKQDVENAIEGQGQQLLILESQVAALRENLAKLRGQRALLIELEEENLGTGTDPGRSDRS